MTKRLSQLASEMRPYWLNDALPVARGTPRSGFNKPYATWVVAAVDSVAPEKANADYVCDGVADEVQITAALAGGGRVVLLDGTYVLSAAATLISGVALVGMGAGVSTLSGSGDLLSGAAIAQAQVEDLTFDGGGLAIATSALDVDVARCEFVGATVGVSLVAPLGCTVIECRFIDCATGVEATDAD
jgi:hypothetical protein